MTRRKIPDDAFDFYVGLGAKRSYAAVADHFGVSKKAVTRCATRESWQERLGKIEVMAQEKADAAVAEDYSVVKERHLRIIKAIQHRALMGLQRMPLSTAMQCVRALDLSMKAEQAILRPPGSDDGGTVIHVVTGMPADQTEPGGMRVIDVESGSRGSAEDVQATEGD